MLKRILLCEAMLMVAAGTVAAQGTSAPVIKAGDSGIAHATYVGSSSCRPCHEKQYDGWVKTRMANVVRDPRQHPEAVLGDFKTPDPVRSFSLDQVAFVYGSHWKQRYFARKVDVKTGREDFYVLPAQWDVKNKRWLPFHVEANADWWVPYYGERNEDRPTSSLCDGCHSVNYNVVTHTVTEWNVGCERCHGPGSEHVGHPTRTNIVNPGGLDSVRANDVCMQCHTQGRAVGNPIRAGDESHYYDWPVGYEPGKRLADYWRLEELKPGATDFYQFADQSAHKNRMQGNDFVQSNMYHRGIRCSDCHDVHNNNSDNLITEGNALCLGCHNSRNPSGLKGTVEMHTHHSASSPGSQCVNCHMPHIAQTLQGQFVSSHTFRFISPELTRLSGVPNPCTSCHKDKDSGWAIAQLRNWQTTSPWRVAN